MVAPSSYCRWCVFGFTLLGSTREASAEDAPTVAPPAAKADATVAVKADATAAPSADLDLLTFYKDNYFLTGFTASREVKFQFSAKFDLWPNRGPHAVYFAFSQKSLWNIYQKSQPFAENNYAPELFYSYFHAPGRYDPAPGCGFFLERVGFVHESDGEDVARSRGWNRVYGESRFACYDSVHHYAALTLQVWYPVSARDNTDIAQYLGYGELSLGVGSERGQGWLGDWEVALHARKGTRDLKTGSLELNARWRPRYGQFWRFTPYLYGQLFTGYGETLLNYDHALTAIRVGIGFSDRSTRSD
jgi:phospholipase A1